MTSRRHTVSMLWRQTGNELCRRRRDQCPASALNNAHFAILDQLVNLGPTKRGEGAKFCDLKSGLVLIKRHVNLRVFFDIKTPRHQDVTTSTGVVTGVSRYGVRLAWKSRIGSHGGAMAQLPALLGQSISCTAS